MSVEKDIAGFSIPFTIGTISTIYVGWLSTSPTVTSLTMLLCLVGVSAFLIHPIHKKTGSTTLWFVISLSALLCGAITGLTAKVSEVCIWEHTGKVTEFAKGCSHMMKSIIKDIAFKHPQTNAIITALLTGERSLLSPDVTEAFRRSGASHILALSGLHLGIIYGIIKAMLSFSRGGYRQYVLKSILIILSCGFYTLATGCGASITRAFLFILLGETANLTSRNKSTGTILLSALFIQILIDPLSVKDVGFQLSYAAMAGIAFIFPILKRFWYSSEDNILSRPFKWLWNTAAMSIACQLTTGPLAYIYFGTFPQHFILTNIISLPLAGLIIPVSLLTITLQGCGICPATLIQFNEFIVACLTDSLKIIAEM